MSQLTDPSPSGLRRSSVRVPGRIRDYLEMTKLRITGLVLLTALTGMWLAGSFPGPVLLVSTLGGTALTVAGANVLNCYLERDRDALMRRTRRRPLPSGRISPRGALVFGLVCGGLGLAVLGWTVHWLCGVLALVAIVSYSPLYTVLKPVTSLSTLIGAVPGALPPVIGWVAVRHRIELPAVLLFVVMFFWQPPHFLALSLFYRRDYERGGHAMLPIEVSRAAAIRQIVLYVAALLTVSLFPVFLGLASGVYLVTALVLGLGFLALGVGGFRWPATDQSTWPRLLFLYSILYLPFLFGVLVWDGVYR